VFAQAQHIDRAVANIEQLTEQHQSEVQGRLRVTCPRPLGQRYLVPLLVEFKQRYPKVEVVLSVDDRMVDLIAEHIDVAIRVAHLEDSTLVARKLSENPRVLVASPAYLARAGTPQTPDDLRHHDCLVYTSGARVFDEWSFSKDGVNTPLRVPGRLQIHDGLARVGAARAWGGVLGPSNCCPTMSCAPVNRCMRCTQRGPGWRSRRRPSSPFCRNGCLPDATAWVAHT